jgi:hypothetical protein
MALHVEEHVVRAFDENLRILFEQEASRLRPYVDVKTGVVGKAASWNVVIGEDAREKVASGSRHADHTQDDLDGIVSWAVLRFFYQALPLDPQDAVKLLVDPRGKYATAIAHALGRKVDEILIAAAVGSATRGEDMGTSTALPSSQKVAAASTGLTVAKLRAAKKILDTNEVPTEGRTIAVNADMMDDLLGATEVTSVDFNSVKALVDGTFQDFMGFRFVRTEKIISTGSSATGAIAFVKTSLGLAIAEEYNRIKQRVDKHDEWEAYGRVQFGATRTDDKGVVQISVA